MIYKFKLHHILSLKNHRINDENYYWFKAYSFIKISNIPYNSMPNHNSHEFPHI
jgi:hypothetical protein